MNKYIFAIGLLFLFCTKAAFSLDEEVKNNVTKIINKKIPEIQIDKIEDSELNGFVKVIYGTDIFYVSEDGKYLIYGELVDLNKNKEIWDLTEETRKKLRLEYLSNIDKDSMIIYKPKKSKTFVTVFTDVDCGFCRKLHKQINDLNKKGIEIRYLAFPRSGPDTESFDKSISVWCADNKKEAIKLAMSGDTVPQKTCDSPVKQHFELGLKMRITGTPTLIFADGTMVSGYMPTENLIELAMEHAN